MKKSAFRESGMIRVLLSYCGLLLALALVISIFVFAIDSEPDEPTALRAETESTTTDLTQPDDEQNVVTEPPETFCVTIVVDGEERQVEAAGETVAELLLAADITLNEQDEVSPSETTTVYNGLRITIVRVTTVCFETEIEIAYETEKQNDAQLFIGETKTLTEGKNGIRKLVFEQTLRDGVMAENRILSNEVVSEPVTRVIRVGTKPLPTTTTKVTSKTTQKTTKKTTTQKTTAKMSTQSPATDSAPDAVTVTVGGKTYEVSKVIQGEAVAYYSNRTNPSTATGNPAIPGKTIAVDPKVIPLGSLVYITSVDGTSWSYGPAYAHDVGGGIKGNIVDLFKASYSECVAHGRRNCIIYVLEP